MLNYCNDDDDNDDDDDEEEGAKMDEWDGKYATAVCACGETCLKTRTN